MNENERIIKIFHEWKELSLEEGEGIQAGDWAGVFRCQDRKRQLMAELDVVRKTYTGDFSRFPEAGDLVGLEKRNALWVEQARSQSQEKRNNLNRASRDLKNVRSAYRRPSEPNWISFS